MKIDSDDFELFGLAPRFEQNRTAIDAQWRALQAKVHPDRFATEGAGERRVAMQWAVRVNEAYQRLKDPLQRAAYLCELRGVPVAAEDNTTMPGEFLMQQMAWREALDEAREVDEVQALAHEVEEQRRQAIETLLVLIDHDGNMPAAAQQVRALMFIERFVDDLDRRLASLGQ